MSRPRKWKTVCALPAITEYSSSGAPGGPVPFIVMKVEEYEVVRLIDGENMTQEECAEHLGVSRPSVQLIYDAARKKLADFLVCGGKLRIGGGDYRLCEEWHQPCSAAYCARYGRKNQKD